VTPGVRARTTVLAVSEAERALDAAMARVGDRWSLQVVDALMAGPCRFSELQVLLPGVAPNVLSARLRRLEHDGLVVAARYSDRPPRHDYRLTEGGRELAGAVLLLTRWGARESGTEPTGPHHRVCGTPLEARWYCPTCVRVTEVAEDDLTWL
jgi:DNA-binding HxlR family transcriptional regulator